MTTLDSFYSLFGVPATCSDAELRRAYRRAILRHHPDRNPHKIESATVQTQKLNSTYAKLKEYRQIGSEVYGKTGGEHGIRIADDGHENSVEFSLGGRSRVDLEDVASRKAAFRNEWERLRKNPSDPITALRLVHAAHRAEQPDSLDSLLLNPILIDCASLLLSLVQRDQACETLIKWSELLQERERAAEALQILEDALAAGASVPPILDKLRSLHYSWAQRDPTSGCKASPDVRIQHLHRILDLGFEYDYIYKQMAEAYHGLADDERASAYLRRAYELNPRLAGAVRISRALGFPARSSAPSHKMKSPSSYRCSRSEQVPSPAQIREWAQIGNWRAVIEAANPHDYSPPILSKARATLRQIATSLGNARAPEHVEALIKLLNFGYYWDVSEAAMTSLSMIGDKHTLRLLEGFETRTPREHAHWTTCVSYLRARIENQRFPTTKAAPQELLAQAEKAYAESNYGQARILLESLLTNEQPHSISVNAMILLARSCAQMNDVRASVEWIKPILPKLSGELRRTVLHELASWLWGEQVFQRYTPAHDEDYRLALETHVELAIAAKTPDDVLANLRRLTRWFELLGEGSIAQWVRQLIRTEAPGTRYVDRHDREQYVQNVDLSPSMRDCLTDIDGRLKVHATANLKRLLAGTHAVNNATLFLGEED